MSCSPNISAMFFRVNKVLYKCSRNINIHELDHEHGHEPVHEVSRMSRTDGQYQPSKFVGDRFVRDGLEGAEAVTYLFRRWGLHSENII